MNDFLNVDHALATTGTRTLEDIVESIQDHPTEPESDNETVEASVDPKTQVSRQDAYKGFDQFRRYVEQNAEDPKIIDMCHKLEDFLHQQQMKSLVQAPITQFMPDKEPKQPSIIRFFT